MNFIEVLLVAIGLSADAFAVAVCLGLSLSKLNFRKALIVGLYFGLFQAFMPVAGYLVAVRFTDHVDRFSHLIVFALLTFLGVKMFLGSFKKESESKQSDGPIPSKMIPLALATSIDALAVGVSFAFLQVSLIPAVSVIGVTTLLLSMVGVKIGSIFGTKFKSKAEKAGGIILILLGIRVLIEHMI